MDLKKDAVAFINSISNPTLKMLHERGGRIFVVKDVDGDPAFLVSAGDPHDRAQHEWVHQEGTPMASISVDADPDFTTDEEGETQTRAPTAKDLAAVREYLVNNADGLIDGFDQACERAGG